MGFAGVTVPKKAEVSWSLLGGALYFPSLVYTIPHMTSPRYFTYSYLVVFDMNNGLPIWIETEKIQRKATEGVITSIVYDMFYQLERKK